MSKPEVLIQAVVVEGLSYGQVAARYGVTKSLVHRLHNRWLAEDDAAFQPRSSRPLSSPNQTPQFVPAIRGGTPEPDLAIRLHPLVADRGRDTEIIGWLDDHARFLLHLSAHHRVSDKTVTEKFTAAARVQGFPASTLTDNGNVYTTKYAGGARGRGSANVNRP